MTSALAKKLEAVEFPPWSRFPVNLLVNDYGLRRWTPKLIWVVIPLEYYVITRFAGGISTGSYLSVVIFTVLCVLSFLVTGYLVALAWPFKSDLQSRSRGMVAALLIVWSTALLLLALSYWLTSLYSGTPKDVLANLAYDMWRYGHGMHEPSFQNFFAHLGYATSAAIIDSLVIRGIWKVRASSTKASRKAQLARAEWIYEPNLFLIVFLVALLMMLLHALTIARLTNLLGGEAG
jgi:hypothetical protein